jgi:cytochrome c
MKSLVVAAALAALLPVAAHAEGDAAKGEKVFKKCMACHTPDATTNKVGPHLGGVIGRKAAAVEGFKYSEAMIAKGQEGLVWDDATLDAYLADPKGYIPKNKMVFVGLKKPDERADVIAFLKSKSGS